MGNLHKKLNDAIGSMDKVAKTGYNNHQGYKYMTEKDIVDAAKIVLIEQGINLTTSYKIIDIREVRNKDKNGNEKLSFLTTVESQHTFTDSESGECLTIMSVGQGHDALDKSVFKAMTGAFKYFLLKNLLVAGEDDPENDSNEHPIPAKPVFSAPPKPVLQQAASMPPTAPKVLPTPKSAPIPAKKPDNWQAKQPLAPGAASKGAPVNQLSFPILEDDKDIAF